MDILTGQEATVKKACRLWEASQLLFDNGYYEDSISRAYYALYHMVKAVMAAKASIVRARWDHYELHKSFLDNFCKRGFIFNKDDGKTFGTLLTLRNNADYFKANLTKKEVHGHLRDAESLLKKIKEVFLENAEN